MDALLDFLIKTNWHHRLAHWLLSHFATVVLVSVAVTLIAIRATIELRYRLRERCIGRRLCGRCGYDLRSTRQPLPRAWPPHAQRSPPAANPHRTLTVPEHCRQT